MRIVRTAQSLTLALLFVCSTASAQDDEMTVTGKLMRAMAIGGESTGWIIKLEPEHSIGGKTADSVEVASGEHKSLEALADKQVVATGKLTRRQGVERGDRYILEISSIKEADTAAADLDLNGSEWLLEDLAGSGVIHNAEATLAFPEAGKVSGHASCNRFFGPAEISGNAIHFGPLGTTRMACPEAVMNQETKYLNALQAAKRFEWKDPYLLIYSAGFEKPLRFTRKSKPAEQGHALNKTDSLYNRIWRVTSSGSTPAPGSIYIFLANGTLLETSCVETYRIATWTIDNAAPSMLRVVEDSQLAFTAHIAAITDRTLHLQQTLARSKERRDIRLTSVDREFVCPDLPR